MGAISRICLEMLPCVPLMSLVNEHVIIWIAGACRFVFLINGELERFSGFAVSHNLVSFSYLRNFMDMSGNVAMCGCL